MMMRKKTKMRVLMMKALLAIVMTKRERMSRTTVTEAMLKWRSLISKR